MKTDSPSSSKEVFAKTRRWWIKQLFLLVIMGGILFLSSGELFWGMAWAYLGSVTLIMIANAFFMDRDLMVERSQLQQGTKKWDIYLSIFVALLGPILVLLIAGFDRRVSWSQEISVKLQMADLIMLLLGGLLGTWSMAANRFFSATVRIQSDRNHIVVSNGPYGYIRHPGYTGGIISNLMVPMVLGSWVALIMATLVAIGYTLRTLFEDRTLQKELTGYKEYSKKVRYRLIPGVW